MPALETVAVAIDGGTEMTWLDIVTPTTSDLEKIVYPRSVETATSRIHDLYPWLERGQVYRSVQLARHKVNAGRVVEAERIVRNLKTDAEFLRPEHGRKTVSPWVYRSAACLTSALVIFGGWAVW
jgi:hypothetical protein